MSEITAAMVKELREQTGAGMMDVKRALTEAGGNMEEATKILRKKGLAAATKKAGRVTSEGAVQAYTSDNVGALVEVNCETDFVARTDDFRHLAYEVALHVAAANPAYLDTSAIPEEVLARKRSELAEQMRSTGSDEDQIARTIDGRLDRWIEEVALLEQPYVRDPKQTVRQLILGVGAKTGENIRVGRFARFKIGE